MSRKTQLGLIVLSAAAMASLISHVLVRVLGIETAPRRIERGGPASGASPLCAAGSSLMFQGLDWNRISGAVGRPVDMCGVPAGSPSELEHIVADLTNDVTFVGVSVYDLNEHLLCDFRSEFVPIRTTLRDILATGADWPSAKRLIGGYPMAYVRKLYPTAGRSLGVMVGSRRVMKSLLGRKGAGKQDLDSEGGPTFSRKESSTERIEDWAPGRTLRNLSQIRAGCQNRWSFDGPKALALQRLLERAQSRGRVGVVVLPVSPPFREHLANEPVKRQFEAALAAAQNRFPNVLWFRVDQLPVLDSPRYYSDLFHLNADGQGVATAAFLERLKSWPGLP